MVELGPSYRVWWSPHPLKTEKGILGSAQLSLYLFTIIWQELHSQLDSAVLQLSYVWVTLQTRFIWIKAEMNLGLAIILSLFLSWNCQHQELYVNIHFYVVSIRSCVSFGWICVYQMWSKTLETKILSHGNHMVPRE